LTELLYQRDHSTIAEQSNLKFGNYVTVWLSDLRLKPTTYQRYAGIVNKYLVPDLGFIPLKDLNKERLEQTYKTWLEHVSPHTLAYHHAIVHRALKDAVKQGLLAGNVADLVALPTYEVPEMQTWAPEEVGQFLASTRTHPLYGLFCLALMGLRRSELLGLKWSDVDLDNAQLSVVRGYHRIHKTDIFTKPKSKKSTRQVDLPPSIVRVLREYRNGETPDSLVFSRDGRPINPNSVTRWWREACQNAGVKAIRLHDARHTLATIMLKKRVHPKVVQELLGHSSIEITMDTYSHVLPGIQTAAVQEYGKLLGL
jgi:integrase